MAFKASGRTVALAVLAALIGSAPAHAQTTGMKSVRIQNELAVDGAEFRCTDGSRMLLSFVGDGQGVFARVRVHGDNYMLANQPPKPGPVQIVWSDGEHSLTWSAGVQLMWMNGATHLMCGRGDHKH